VSSVRLYCIGQTALWHKILQFSQKINFSCFYCSVNTRFYRRCKKRFSCFYTCHVFRPTFFNVFLFCQLFYLKNIHWKFKNFEKHFWDLKVAGADCRAVHYAVPIATRAVTLCSRHSHYVKLWIATNWIVSAIQQLQQLAPHSKRLKKLGLTFFIQLFKHFYFSTVFNVFNVFSRTFFIYGYYYLHVYTIFTCGNQ